MNEFAKIMREERLQQRIKLRHISELVNLSIGYLSDIEHGRKHPPETKVVRAIEKILGITDGRMEIAATKVRKQTADGISHLLKERPQMRELLTRADHLDEDQLRELIKNLPAF